MIINIAIFFLASFVLAALMYWHDTRETDRYDEARKRGK